VGGAPQAEALAAECHTAQGIPGVWEKGVAVDKTGTKWLVAGALALGLLGMAASTGFPSAAQEQPSAEARAAEREAIRQGLEAIHAAEVQTLAEGKYLLLSQHLNAGRLDDLSSRIIQGRHWDLLPELEKILDRHKQHFVDADECGRCEMWVTYREAIRALAHTREGAAYLAELAGSVRGKLWLALILDMMALYSPVEELPADSARALADVLRGFSTGPLGSSLTWGCFVLKRRLSLLTPIETMFYAAVDQPMEGDWEFPAIVSITYADRNRNGDMECHIETVERVSGGAHGGGERQRVWVFESSGQDFNPLAAMLVFACTTRDVMAHKEYVRETTARYTFTSSGKAALWGTVDYQGRRLVCDYDTIEVEATLKQSDDPHEPCRIVATVCETWRWEEGKYVLKDRLRKEVLPEPGN